MLHQYTSNEWIKQPGILTQAIADFAYPQGDMIGAVTRRYM